MGEPSVNQLLGRVASFSLSFAARQKAVEALQNTVTGFDHVCVKKENVGDGMPARVMACTKYVKVPAHEFSGSPSNPNSFILANAARFGGSVVQKATAEILGGQADIESSSGRSLNCYVGGKDFKYGLVCEPKPALAEKSWMDMHEYGPKY